MARQDTRQLMQRLVGDARLRRSFMADPAGVIAASGLSIDADDAAALRSMDWSRTDEQLQARVNRDCAQLCEGGEPAKDGGEGTHGPGCSGSWAGKACAG